MQEYSVSNTSDLMRGRSDKEIVDLLWQGDSNAWEFIFHEAVIPALRYGRVADIVRERGLEAEEVLSMVYERMVGKEALKNYQYRGKVQVWMKYYVSGLVYTYCKKNPYPVSDETLQKTYSDVSAKKSTGEEWEIARKCFSEMWSANPMRAYIHLLRLRYDMPAAEIKDMLQISSEDNVHQMFSRAIKDMKRLRTKYGS